MQKQINKLFTEKEINILKSLIGQKIDKIRHDRFDYTNTSFKRITFFVGNKVYELLNEAEETDFMWDDYGEEAVAVFKFSEIEDKGMDHKYGFDNYPAQIETPINDVIKDIIVIEDNVKAYDYKTKALVSEYDYVKGIIIELNHSKYCFNRGIWFSEEIVINKGQEPESKIGNIDNDWEWGEDRYSINTRTFRSLK